MISNGGDGMKAISCESTTLNNVFEVEFLRTSNDPIDDASNRNLYRRPFTNRQGVSSDRGNNSVTLTYLDSPTQYFNTALTTARAVTLPTMDLSKNHRFRVVRGASASGAFNLTVTDGTTTFKALTASSQWCEVEWDGSAWRLTANGSL